MERILPVEPRLNTIKAILAKYTAFFLSLLGTLGVFGAFVIATVDAAAFGIPLDPVIIGYAVLYKEAPWMIVLACVLAAAGSALGSLLPYWIGRKGGESLLLRRISHARLEELRDRYESWEFFFVMVPSMLPPPTPMKLIVLAAGAFEMRVRLFVAALFLGRILRFGLVSYLVIAYGPDIVRLVTHGMRRHVWLVLGSLLMLLLLIVLVRRTFNHRNHRRKDT
jgi:membrane protein YqaA with SNARE-associated domain